MAPPCVSLYTTCFCCQIISDPEDQHGWPGVSQLFDVPSSIQNPYPEVGLTCSTRYNIHISYTISISNSKMNLILFKPATCVKMPPEHTPHQEPLTLPLKAMVLATELAPELSRFISVSPNGEGCKTQSHRSRSMPAEAGEPSFRGKEGSSK